MRGAEQVDNRTKNGTFRKGHSGNPNGRPQESHAEKFRMDPHAPGILTKIYEIANTLGTDGEHKDAMACVKLIADKLIPTLKSQELEVSGVDKGYVVIPEQKASRKEKKSP